MLAWVPHGEQSSWGVAGAVARGLSARGWTITQNWAPIPDICVICGDRWEMLNRAAEAVRFGIPIAHVHAGELTLGCVDQQIRDALSQLAGIRFAPHQSAAQRCSRLPGKTIISGSPCADEAEEYIRENPAAAATPKTILFVMHPANAPGVDPKPELAIFDEIERLVADGWRVYSSQPNGDYDPHDLRGRWKRLAQKLDVVGHYDNQSDWWRLMRSVVCCVGNSSSFIIEGPTLSAKSHIVGARQNGRALALCSAYGSISSAAEAPRPDGNTNPYLAPLVPVQGMIGPGLRRKAMDIISEGLISYLEAK